MLPKCPPEMPCILRPKKCERDESRVEMGVGLFGLHRFLFILTVSVLSIVFFARLLVFLRRAFFLAHFVVAGQFCHSSSMKSSAQGLVFLFVHRFAA